MNRNILVTVALAAGFLAGCQGGRQESIRQADQELRGHFGQNAGQKHSRGRGHGNGHGHGHGQGGNQCDELGTGTGIQLGTRPYFLIDDMDESALKDDLLACAPGPFTRTNFSIGHRGAPLQYPEHTKESYVAAARMGAGIMECDVTFTKDRELVCRHSQCDLHTTTNILLTDLADKCTQPFSPADPNVPGSVASAQCCTSDITLEEFKTLCGKMDASNSKATTAEEYVGGTAEYRTDLYSTCGTLLTHSESIELFDSLGLDFTPELKSASVEMPYEGDYTQEDYARQMIAEYKAAGIAPRRVWAQSFSLDDILFWINSAPAFGKQAVFLDGRYEDPAFDHTNPATYEPSMEELVEMGVNVLAPPTFMLVQNCGGAIAPSVYAEQAKAAGLDLITWTFERSGFIATGGGFYYETIGDLTNNEGDAYHLLDVLAQDVGIIGIFSDWPASVTYYANCMGL